MKREKTAVQSDAPSFAGMEGIRRAVQPRNQRDGQCFLGRIEHLSSGRRAHFESPEQLLASLGRLVAELGSRHHESANVCYTQPIYEAAPITQSCPTGQRRMSMQRVLTSLIAVLSLCVAFAATVATAADEKPDGTIELSGGSVAVGIGFAWGSGKLHYKGKSYDIDVKVSMSGTSAPPRSRPPARSST
jgi:hypothetical protein